MPFSIAGLSRTPKSGRRGSVAIQIGILMTVLIGMAGLGTEIPFLMFKHRQMQTAADSAALSAAVALSQGYPAITTEANGVAAALGFVNGTGNVTVTVNNPPKSGNYTSNSSAVEVIVTQPQTLKMAGLLGVSQYNLTARAVALSGSGSSTYCMLALDPIGSGWAMAGVGLWGGVQLWMSGCGMAVNASGAGALTLSSGGTLAAPLVSLVGQLNNVWSTVWATVKQNQAAVADPYASVAMPSAGTGCGTNGTTGTWASSSQLTLSPGIYCNGLSFGGGYTWTLLPGVYYIKSGQFNIAGGASVNGTGVTIVLTTADAANSYATVSITNGANVVLSAPTTGSAAGILFFGDRNAPSNITDTFSGFNYMNLIGAIYVPTHVFQYGGGGWIAGCTQLIAWHVDDYINGLLFDGTCMGGTGMKTIGGSSTVLAE